VPNTARGYPYPEPTNSPTVPFHIQQLAGAIDGDVTGVISTIEPTVQAKLDAEVGPAVDAAVSAVIPDVSTSPDGKILVTQGGALTVGDAPSGGSGGNWLPITMAEFETIFPDPGTLYLIKG
jgi:hypothetical protein